ncbi:YceI family protein [Altererythrobacter sp. GH1-8]|uniref:YceI family protein n=1 Tax=Altererythrobacter sp. GH1-8 TaxID=3349333 RepID=UPI00374D86BD
MMAFLRALLSCVFAAALISASPAGQVYSVDSAQSALNAKVGFFGIGSKTAGFPQVSGSIRLDRTRPEAIDLDVTINARALTASDEVTLSRLKSEKFFWVQKYPQVRFVGREMKLDTPTTGNVKGELTARGVTQPVTLKVRFDKDPTALLPGEAVTLSGTTRINRRDFGMKSYSLIVGKMVDIELRARLVPQG